jgi:hypothetical protein
LQIYHDSSDSYITESGTGSLYIGADSTIALTDAAVTQNKAQFITGGAVNLFHNNAQKFATTATGVDVTGTVTADGLTVDTSDQVIINHSGDGGGIRIDSTNNTNTSSLRFGDAADNYIGAVEYNHSTDALSFYVNNATRTTISSAGILTTQCTAGSGNYALGAYNPTSTSSRAIALFQSNVGGTQENKVVIQCDGSVGIGTASPGELLHCSLPSGTNGDIVRLSRSAGAYSFQLGVSSGSTSNLYISDSSNNNIIDFTSSGNVGIGTSSPHSGSKLHILAAGTTQLRLDSSGAATGDGSFIRFMKGGTDIAYIGVAGTIMGSTSNDTMFYGNGANNMRFSTNGVERIRITSAGTVAIGTASPISGTMLDIRPTSTTRIMNTRSFNTSLQFHHAFENNSGTLVGSIAVGTSSTAYNTSSDYRLKENVTDITDATTRLKQLNPVRFNFIADADTTVDGFLAHEVQDIVPEAITGTKDAMMDEEYTVSAATGDIYTPAVEATYDEDDVELTAAVDEIIHSADVEQPEELAEGQLWRETTAAVIGTRSVPDYQGIDQSKLVPLLVKTIQELEARIAALETA